ncbi:MAG: putative motility protein [Candidatus Omnitrophota bacterium]
MEITGSVSTSSQAASQMLSAAPNASVGISVLKKTLNMAVVQQIDLMRMMKELSPHLGQNVDILA